MLNQKIKSLTDLSGLLARAEAEFEKKSGWKSKEIRSTLENFSRLNTWNKAMFGGILVGRAILRGSGLASAPKARAKRSAKGVTAVHVGAPAATSASA